MFFLLHEFFFILIRREEIQKIPFFLYQEDKKMSGKGKGKGHKKSNVSKSSRAGLQFPVGRIARHLKKGRYAARLGGGAPVYLAAVLEYLAAEILDQAGNAARDNKRARITPRHLQLAIRQDEELDKLFQGVTIASGGVIPNIHNFLLPKKKQADDGTWITVTKKAKKRTKTHHKPSTGGTPTSPKKKTAKPRPRLTPEQKATKKEDKKQAKRLSSASKKLDKAHAKKHGKEPSAAQVALQKITALKTGIDKTAEQAKKAEDKVDQQVANGASNSSVAVAEQKVVEHQEKVAEQVQAALPVMVQEMAALEQQGKEKAAEKVAEAIHDVAQVALNSGGVMDGKEEKKINKALDKADERMIHNKIKSDELKIERYPLYEPGMTRAQITAKFTKATGASQTTFMTGGGVHRCQPFGPHELNRIFNTVFASKQDLTLWTLEGKPDGKVKDVKAFLLTSNKSLFAKKPWYTDSEDKESTADNIPKLWDEGKLAFFSEDEKGYQVDHEADKYAKNAHEIILACGDRSKGGKGEARPHVRGGARLLVNHVLKEEKGKWWVEVKQTDFKSLWGSYLGFNTVRLLDKHKQDDSARSARSYYAYRDV